MLCGNLNRGGVWGRMDTCIGRGFPSGTNGKNSTRPCRRHKKLGFDPWVGKVPWRRKWQPAPVFLHGKFHGQRSPVGSSPWGNKESNTTEHTHT